MAVMHTHSLCSPTFKIDVYSARYTKGKPNLFCYLKYNEEMTNESSLIDFFHSTHLLKNCNVTPLQHVIIIENSVTERLTPKPIIY